MTKRSLTHHHEATKIYRRYYKPSLNFIRLFKSVLFIFISGSSPATTTHYRKR